MGKYIVTNKEYLQYLNTNSKHKICYIFIYKDRISLSTFIVENNEEYVKIENKKKKIIDIINKRNYDIFFICEDDEIKNTLIVNNKDIVIKCINIKKINI